MILKQIKEIYFHFFIKLKIHIFLKFILNIKERNRNIYVSYWSIFNLF
jgi:hypothetical protein